MTNNKQQPKPENPNNQFSNTEPLTHAQKVSIANTMSNNKQSSVEWLFNQLVANRIIVINGTTYSDKVKAKYEIILEQAKAMHKEETEAKYQEGREIGKIEVLTSQSTKNASDYRQGYNKGFLAALEYMNSTVENKIKLRKYEQ